MRPMNSSCVLGREKGERDRGVGVAREKEAERAGKHPTHTVTCNTSVIQ